MARYTTLVKSVCEGITGLTEKSSMDLIVERAVPLIFDFNYRSGSGFSEELYFKILSHYYFYEIGFETYGIWKAYLRNTLREIFPYYEQLYKSAELEFNPLEDVKISRIIKADKTNNITKDNTNDMNKSLNKSVDSVNDMNKSLNKSVDTVNDMNKSLNKSVDTVTENNATNTVENVNAKSDTPQGTLQNVKELKYLSSADVDNNTGTTTATITDNVTQTDIETNKIIEKGTQTDIETNKIIEKGTETDIETNKIIEKGTEQATGNENTTETLTGKNSGQSFSRLLAEYRETILNIDMLIIDELKELFMMIY